MWQCFVCSCCSHVNLENNNGDGHDPIYDDELYLNDVAALLADDNDQSKHTKNIGDRRCIDSRLNLKASLQTLSLK